MDYFNLITTYLNNSSSDAYIIIDYESKNPTLVNLLGNFMLTRKIFLILEKESRYIICHSIDAKVLEANNITKDYKLYIYNTWQEMLDLEKKLFSKYKQVMMDYSESGLLPRISFVDYGSMKYILDLGIKVISSQDLLQEINATYDEESYKLQLKACELILKIKDDAFNYIKANILSKKKISEYDVQQYICNCFIENNLITDDPPIVAIGINASNPHYFPNKDNSSIISKGDLVLIDLWAKLNHPKAVYADITWMGYVGDNVPKVYSDRFNVLKNTIDQDIRFLENNIPNRDVYAYEVDRLGRDYINLTNYGKYFTHRTGHNISVDATSHGPGANIDDFETHDTRKLINNTSFSLEPGIYAPDFGMRSETNITIRDNKVIVVAGRQKEIIPILK